MSSNPDTFLGSLLIPSLVLGLLLFPVLAQAQTSPRTLSDTATDTNPLPSHIAIRVESETVPMETFRNRVDQLFSNYKREAQKKGKEYDTETVKEKLGDKVKRRMISRLLLEVHSRRKGVTVPAEKFEKQWNQSIEQAGSLEEYRQRIEKQGLTLEEAKEEVRVRLRRRQLLTDKISKVSVTDTEIKQVYMNNRKRFETVGRQRAIRFIRRQVLEEKQNQASKAFIASLRRKSLVQTNV